MMKNLFSYLLYCSIAVCINIYSITGKIIANKVNARRSRSISSKILFQLKKNDRIKILRYDTNINFVNNYLGVWCYVKTEKSGPGYVLSSFIMTNEGEEKFHNFFNEFCTEIKYKNDFYFSNRVKLPLKRVVCVNNNCTEKFLQFSEIDLYKEFRIFDFNKIDMQIFYYRNGRPQILYSIDKETRYRYIFDNESGRWFLVEWNVLR